MIQPVDNNQLVTKQMLFQQGAMVSNNPEPTEYDRKHKIVDKQNCGIMDPNTWDLVNISGYSSNQCVPFSACYTYGIQPIMTGYTTLNRTSMGSTSGVSITHSGVVNVYIYSPNFYFRRWYTDGYAFQLMCWNGKTGSSFVGERNCYLYDNTKLRTLTDARYGDIKSFNTVDYNYTNGYVRLFTSSWYAALPNLKSTAYLSLIINDSEDYWNGNWEVGSFPGAFTTLYYSMHTQSNLGGSTYYYQLHNAIQLSTAKGTTTNIYINTTDESSWSS